MRTFYGLDEAGYGPNLGPLVVSVTRWDLPRSVDQCDLLTELAEVLSGDSTEAGTRLHVADSKAVYNPGRGLTSLELSALCLLRQVGYAVRSLHDLWDVLTGGRPDDLEPWFGEDLPLPLCADVDVVEDFSARLAGVLDRQGIRLTAISSDIVQTARFNRLTLQHDSKGAALSGITLGLLSRHWNPLRDEAAYVVLDKHGGRNRYDNLLLSVFPDVFPQCLAEGRECSRYRLGPHECRFQTKAEVHLPVAAASIISKYAREVSMEAFNRFWRSHAPALKPTKGYPGDAARFRTDVREVQSRLRISDEVFWRTR